MKRTREASFMNEQSSEPPGMYNPLTELYNKALFIQVMQSLLRISMRQQMPVTLAIARIDDYSEIYDTHSLSETNHLLKDTADLIKSISRDSDVLAHFEEDKFALLLYNCGSKSSHIATDRLRSNIAEDIKFEDQPLAVTIGVSTFGETNIIGRSKTVEMISDELIAEALKDLDKTEEKEPKNYYV